MNLAKRISEKIECEILVKESNDPRSYRQDSSKLLKTGFKPKKTVSHAIDEIIVAFKRGELRDEPHFHNLNWMNKMIRNQREIAQ